MFDLSWVEIGAGSVKCRAGISEPGFTAAAVSVLCFRQAEHQHSSCPRLAAYQQRRLDECRLDKTATCNYEETKEGFPNANAAEYFCLIEPLLLLKKAQTVMLMKDMIILSQTIK